MMPDHLIDDEAQEFLGEIGIQIGIGGQLAQAGNLALLPPRIGGGKSWVALCSPTACVILNRSASMKTSAASILSMLSR